MKVKTTVVTPVGTFESDVSEGITQEAYAEAKEFYQKAKDMKHVSIVRGNDWIVFTHNVIANSVLILTVVDNEEGTQ